MHRKLLRLLPIFAFLPLCAPALQAQTPDCQFTIIMRDAYGDGWNGGVLTVTSGPLSTPFTLVTGVADTMTFDVYNGQPLTFTWVQGSYLYEVSYQILDNTGSVIAQATAPGMPASGVLYSGIGHCVTCSPPVNFRVDDVWDTYVKLRWSANSASPNPAVAYRVIYGLKGFNVAAGEGDTASTTTTKITINGLQKKTWYDAYIEQDCGATGGWSDKTGPIAFQTYWTKDVGITGVVSPVSSCGLGSADTVRILLKNYGSAPQSLIPFRYTINGEEVNIPKPDDGVYTGVLGKDSVETVAFETTYDFSDPGEYIIVAYTKFTGDQDVHNDTFTTIITNRLLSPYLQGFETWSGGMQVVAEGNTPTFVYGTPNKTSIPAAANGQKAWVTSLTGTYNPDELTYLESPCFDFSQLTVDPVITFSIARDLETKYDAAWFELSVDGGDTWNKVGAIDEGLNWYNENIVQGTFAGESWSGSSDGWVTARHLLNGAAGASGVRFRFVVASDLSLQYGGLGIDDIHIFPAFNKDLAGRAVSVSTENEVCGQQNEPVSFTFVNIGAQTQNGFQVAYSINGGTPVVETINNPLAPDQSTTYTFNATFDSRDARSEIKCWTRLAGEFSTANDTAILVVDHRPLPVPLHEDFESQALPQGWTSDGTVTDGHGNSSWVLAVNMYAFNAESIHDLPRYGIIGANDSLEFSYRVVDYDNEEGMPLSPGTQFELQVSDDCGDTFQTLYTIDNQNHQETADMQTIKVGLGQYAGSSIRIRFLSTWSDGDFWFDVDNINLLSCAADMALTADVVHTSPGQNNGAATVQVGLGNPPYTYHWSNGATTETVGNLATGSYTVTVTDALGCTDSFVFSVGATATQEIDGLSAFTLQPNPTSGETTVVAMFNREVSDAQLQIVNLLGQPVWQSTTVNTAGFSEKIDLSRLPSGLYFVRLTVEGQVATKRLILR